MRTFRSNWILYGTLSLLTAGVYAGGSRKPFDPATANQSTDPTPSTKASPMTPDASNTIPGEYLIAFESPAAASKRADLFKRHGATEKQKVGAGHLYLIEVQGDSKEIIAAMEKESGVRYIEPNLKMHLMPMKQDAKKSHHKKSE